MSAINSLAGTASNPTGVNRLNELSSDEFLEIMLKELTTQDPFEPNDTAQILEQLSSLRNIESQTSLQENLETMVTQNAVASAGGFIGKYVKGLDEANATVAGTVSSLRIENGQPILILDSGATLAADRITEVSDTSGGANDANTELLQQALAGLALLDSSSMIGKLVSGSDENGEVTGVVTSIRHDEPGNIVLELDNGRTLAVDAVKQISPYDPAAATN